MLLDLKIVKEYYSRPDVYKSLMKLAKNREVQAWFGDIRGRRPEIVNYDGDIKDLIKQGMTSFHVSEERWQDPLKLEAGLGKRQLDELRLGWDVLIDLDSKDLNLSLICGELIIDALKFHDIKYYSIKYSGNRGLHIAIPFEAFPSEVNGINIKNYFPDGVRVISEYLKDMIKEFLIAKILEKYRIEDVAKNVGKEVKDLIVYGKFNPYEAVDIDSVLISSRHLFRSVYSINEKSGLVSIPLEKIADFDIENARIGNVKVNKKFLYLDDIDKGEARQLLIQAFDWAKKNINAIDLKLQPPKTFELPKIPIKPDYFPMCILKLMAGVKEDGKKRGVFILVNFLQSIGWNLDDIEKFLMEWNKKNTPPLVEGYIKAQINWFKRQNKKVLPPNCNNNSYYMSMGIKCEDSICNMCKNPVSYAIKRARIEESNMKNKKIKYIKK